MITMNRENLSLVEEIEKDFGLSLKLYQKIFLALFISSKDVIAANKIKELIRKEYL